MFCADLEGCERRVDERLRGDSARRDQGRMRREAPLLRLSLLPEGCPRMFIDENGSASWGAGRYLGRFALAEIPPRQFCAAGCVTAILLGC